MVVWNWKKKEQGTGNGLEGNKDLDVLKSRTERCLELAPHGAFLSSCLGARAAKNRQQLKLGKGA